MRRESLGASFKEEYRKRRRGKEGTERGSKVRIKKAYRERRKSRDEKM